MRVVRSVLGLIALAALAAVQASAGATEGYRPGGVSGSCGWSLGSARLPTARPGGECGAGVAKCPAWQCCSQYGRCEAACSATCQCEYSGRRSYCPGSLLLTDVGVPEAPLGGICGKGVARCPDSQCCSVLGQCTDDAAQCSAGACSQELYGKHSPCRPRLPKVRRYDLTLRWEWRAPDGYRRRVITANSMMPGPTLTCEVGDRLVIRVRNNLPEPTTIHWHGILQRGSVIMDGVPGVTQLDIPPFSSQLYDFICPTAGLYWYHSHYKAQYIDGLKGALLITDAQRQTYPAESVAQLSDWYHAPSERLLNYYLTPASEGDEPVPISALINSIGQGSANCTTSRCSYSVFPAAPGGTCANYRTKLRFINTSGFAAFRVSIDAHLMRVFALDAITIQVSEPLRFIEINAGQRVSVFVCADPARPGGYRPNDPAWIRAHMIQSVFATPAPNPTVLGILQYGPASDRPRALPTTQPYVYSEDEPLMLKSNVARTAAVQPVNEYELKPLSPYPPPPATTTITLNLEMYNDPYPNSTNWAHFNSISMAIPPAKGPRVPSIVEAMLANRALPPNSDFGYHTIKLKRGDVVELVINNYDTGEHPLHLHGHWFWVMARGAPNEGAYNPATTTLKTTPLLRDTATVNLKSYMVIRFIASNPGAWIFHCHIDWHLAAGLAVVFAYT